MFMHNRYPVMPVGGGSTMHVLEGQRHRTNVCVCSMLKERNFKKTKTKNK